MVNEESIAVLTSSINGLERENAVLRKENERLRAVGLACYDIARRYWGSCALFHEARVLFRASF